MDLEQITVTIRVVFAGICCAAFYAYYQRCLLGDIVRAFLSAEAIDPQNAKTLAEIGYGDRLRRAFAERALKNGTALRKTVHALYPESNPIRRHKDELLIGKTQSSRSNEKSQPQRYYVPEELRHTAEVRYDSKGTSPTTVLVTVAAFFVAAVVIITLLPWIRDRISSFGRTNDREDNSYSQTVNDSDALRDTDNTDKTDETRESEYANNAEQTAYTNQAETVKEFEVFEDTEFSESFGSAPMSPYSSRK